MLSNNTGYSGVVVLADAVRFTYIAPLPQPTPPRIDQITVQPDGRARLQVTGAPGQYAIDATTNLSSWAEVTNFTSTGPSFEWLDPQGGFGQRYYQVRLVQ
jgi:hypothetical protein